jgi:IPT/TIG domain
MPALSWRRLGTIAAAPIAFVMCGGVFMASTTAVTTVGQPYTNTFNYGSPASPQAIVPSDMDVQIHVRAPSNQMTDPMNAGHGADCSAPPATHTIQNLSDGLFACKNHLMTAIGDSDYGEIALTPNHMADWSTGTTTITFNVSTQQFNASDWLEVWLTPFSDNTSMPFSGNPVDFQGPPKNAIIFSLDQSELMGTMSGDVTPVQNYVLQSHLPKVACKYIPDPQCINAYGATSAVPLSAVTRTQYEIDISQGHIRFGLPGVVWWTDTNVNVPFTQALVTLAHHSYNPLKHDAGTGIDTYHWSNFAISNAVPFTILNGAERVINGSTLSTIHFPAAAPAGSYLRFSALGTMSISLDGGTTWQAAVMQGLHTHDEHFQTYMTPIPAGTTSVMVSGIDNQYAQPWWIRDPAIWSQAATPPPPNAPTVGSLAPNNGPLAGGTSVTVIGTNFTGATGVTFGTAPATTFTVNGATQLTATSPAGSGTVDVLVTTPAGSSAVSAADKFAYTPPPGAYTTQNPNRILDTRLTAQTLGPNSSLNLTVAGGTTGVPAGATGVILNVTVTNTTAPSYLTLWPAGATRATVSNLNWMAGDTRANLANVPVGSGGQVSIYNGAGSADVVVDEEGYFAAPNGMAGGYNALAPQRLLDTRTSGPTMSAGSTRDLQVLGSGGMPAAGVSAVVLNLTATNTTTPGFFTVFPSGTTRPTASNVNWVAGMTLPNRVIVKVPANGMITIYNAQGSADAVIDVSGYFTDSTASGKFFNPLTPTRVLDTRISASTLGPNWAMSTQITGINGVPLGASAVFLNATVTNTTGSSFLTAYPDLTSRPVASDLNWVAGQTIPNLVLATLSLSGTASFYNVAGSTDLVLDISGWFS